MSEPSHSEYSDRKGAETEIRPGKYVLIIELPSHDRDKRGVTDTITVFEGRSRDQVEKSVKNRVGWIGLHNFGLRVDETGTAEINVSLADFKTYDPDGDNKIVHSFTYQVDHEGHAK